MVSTTPSLSSSSCDNAVPKPVSFQGRITGPTRRSTKGGWTEEEDKILAVAVQKFNGKNWKKIAECVPDRTDVQCLHRWQKVLNPDLVKGPWSKEEDDLIIELVAKQGKKKWSEIAKFLPGRIGKQCRERWHNHLNPDIKKTAWTKEEESTLIKAHQIYGNKWAEIAKFLDGRTENSIKNHWNCSVRKKLESINFARVSGPYGHKATAECRKSVEVKESRDPKLNFEGSADTCSLDLILEMTESNLQPSNKEECRSLKGGENDITKPRCRTNLHDGDAVSCGPSGKQCQKRANNGDTFREPYHAAIKTNELLHTSSSHQVKFQCLDEQVHEPHQSVNPLPSGGHSRPLQLSLRTHSDVPGCNILTSNFLHEPAFPAAASRLHESSYVPPQHNVCYVDYFENRNSKLCGQNKDTLSCRTACETYEESKVFRAPANLEDSNVGSLCYKSLFQKDLNTLVKTGTFPSTDSYIQTASSPVSFNTPSSHNTGVTVDGSSPESILRSAARSFINTPSIIRKRRFKISRTFDNLNQKDGVCSLEENRDNSDNSHHLLHRCPPDRHDNNGVLSNEKQLFLPPLKSQKLGSSAAVKSVEKCLEHAFDSEWASTNIK
ncbi:hypothetical protein I3843_01G052000 [Carya illinoinensis]|nr:hypothetical protein I3843_01G052000 [Carya illinoinensis]KAG7994304.1 hypothetical protein I3843_01G052000 [Carya illinoinensis]KAG7994305.1 hypothetical protein I3843_01G052000 [Carya illinoinensis]